MVFASPVGGFAAVADRYIKIQTLLVLTLTGRMVTRRKSDVWKYLDTINKMNVLISSVCAVQKGWLTLTCSFARAFVKYPFLTFDLILASAQ